MPCCYRKEHTQGVSRSFWPRTIWVSAVRGHVSCNNLSGKRVQSVCSNSLSNDLHHPSCLTGEGPTVCQELGCGLAPGAAVQPRESRTKEAHTSMPRNDQPCVDGLLTNHSRLSKILLSPDPQQKGLILGVLRIGVTKVEPRPLNTILEVCMCPFSRAGLPAALMCMFVTVHVQTDRRRGAVSLDFYLQRSHGRVETSSAPEPLTFLAVQ